MRRILSLLALAFVLTSAVTLIPTAAQAAPASSAGCDTGVLVPGYNGTSAARKASHRDIQDQVKELNYPCTFDESVKGIRIDPGSVSLVKGGRLVKTIPLPATPGNVVTLPEIVKAVNDPTWISMPAPDTVELAVALVQEPKTTLLIGAPITTVHIDAGSGVLIGGTNAVCNMIGVYVSSWDPMTRKPVPTPTVQRPSIFYENSSTLNISKSHFNYLGTDATSSYGVSWGTDTGGLVDQSLFENGFFGVYTAGAKNLIVQHSVMRNNVYYGIDPHTYSSHLTFKYNNVYGNGSHGIVFSRYVTDSDVEYNNSHDNKANGIMMDLHSDNNTIAHNTVTNNAEGIVFSGSAKGQTFDNTVTNNSVGIRVSNAGSDTDAFHDNTVIGGKTGIKLYGGATTTVLTHNMVSGAKSVGILVDSPRSVLINNMVSNVPTGVKISTVASITGGVLKAKVVGLSITNEAFATITRVKVTAIKPAISSGKPVATFTGTNYHLPIIRSTPTALDIIGVSILCFALLCEFVHLLRRRQVRQVSMALAGLSPGSAAFVGGGTTDLKGLRRAAIRVVKPNDIPVQAGAVPARTVGRRFRPDIEGLRAVAVVAVVINHAGLGLPGGYIGVDVFFVISGYLISRQLLDEVNRTGHRFSFTRFYARRIRRILPAATLVIVSTLFAAYAWTSLRFAGIAKDGLASALFSVNWRLAATGTDYFQATAPPSPFQHYWSLSVEEQFYFAWPIILAVLLLLARGQHRTKVLTAALLVIIGASLAASVIVTHKSQPFGYFGTDTHVWELAMGALVAGLAARLRQIPGRRVRRAAQRLPAHRRARTGPDPVSAVAAWAGLSVILVTCFLYNGNTEYPGYAAMAPVAGAAVFIAAGCGAAPKWGPEMILRQYPFKWVGRLSYSLYLWHWPLLVLLPVAVGHPLSVKNRLALVGIALLLSILTYALVEQPVRNKRSLIVKPRHAFELGVALIATSVIVALVLPMTITQPGADAPASTSEVAAALAASTTNGTYAEFTAAVQAATLVTNLPKNVTPSLAEAPHSFPYLKSCEVGRPVLAPRINPCNSFGDPKGIKQVVLVGDSHAGMWGAGINAVAKQNHWKLAIYNKTGCPVANYPDWVDGTLKRVYTECNSWRAAVIKQIASLHPALVIIGTEARPAGVNEPNGMADSVTALEKSGAKVALLADVPNPGRTDVVPDCLAAHQSDIQACAVPLAKAFIPGRTAEMDSARRAGATVVDPTPWFCTSITCPVVISNVIVFADDSHITGTYGAFLAPELNRAFADLVN